MRNIVALYTSALLASAGKSGGGRILPDLKAANKAAADKAAKKAEEAAQAQAEAEAKAQKAAAKQERENAAKAAGRQVDYRQAKRENAAKFQEEYGHMLFHRGEITKGKHKGKSGDIVWIGANRFNIAQPLMRLDDDGTTYWVNPEIVTKGAAIPKARKAVIEAEEKERSEATVLVPGLVTKETEEGLIMSYTGWFRRVPFAKADVTKVGTLGELDVFEVPAWKVRNACGQDSVDVLNGKREAIEAQMTASE